MALPKYSDPAVQNKTGDEATNRVDNISGKLYTPAKKKDAGKKKPAGKTRIINSAKNKTKGFKEGNKDDNVIDEDNTDYTGNKNFFDDEEDDDAEYHQPYYRKR